MRVAIFSDVHGNLSALEAVLQDIEEQKPDVTLFAGDLCVFGPRPRACLQRVRESDIGCVFGNTDGWINNDPLLSDNLEAEEAERTFSAQDASGWTWAQLEPSDRAWLRTLSFHRRVSPTVDPHDDLFVVHANPLDVDQPIYPSESRQKEIYGQVKQPDDALQPLLGELAAGVLAFGHVHIPNIRQWGRLVLANVSSVSLPLDGDTRAKYGLLTWDDGSWSVDFRRIEYDIEQEFRLLRQLRPPQWRKNGRQLKSALPPG